MKKLVYSLVVVAFISFIFGCKPSVEKQLAGTWTLEKAELTNLDEIVKASVDQATKGIDDSLKAIEAKMKDAKGDAKKELEKNKKMYEDQKAQINPDKMKEGMTKGMDEMVGKATFTFKEDKTYEVNMGGQPSTGTFTVAADGKSITTKDKEGKEETVAIDEIAPAKLVISGSQKSGEMVMKMKMSFKK